MAKRQSRAQKQTIGRVMREFKHGELKAGGGNGPKVRNPKQAIAIALSEAGASNRQSPAENRRRQAETGKRARNGARARRRPASRRAGSADKDGERPATKADLLAEARRRGLAGRSRMSRDQLARALGR